MGGLRQAPLCRPKAVLAYLSRYTHARRHLKPALLSIDEAGVSFRYKDYRRIGPERQQVMTLEPHEFIRRFLLHVLPRGSTASAITVCSPAARERPASTAPGTAGGATAVGTIRSRGTIRFAPALSVLRRAHDHHRDLGALDAARAPPQKTASTGNTPP